MPMSRRVWLWFQPGLFAAQTAPMPPEKNTAEQQSVNMFLTCCNAYKSITA
jgi:hypothetical protein